MSQVIKLQAPKFGIGEWVRLKGCGTLYTIGEIFAQDSNWMYECALGGLVVKGDRVFHDFKESQIEAVTITAKDE